MTKLSYINPPLLDDGEKRFATGDRGSLLVAIWYCAKKRQPLPEWASKVFITAYESGVGGEVKSWDDVFGKPYPKGSNLNAIKKRLEKRGALTNRIRQMKNKDPSIAIDVALFEKVGSEFGVGKTLANEYYYEVKHWMEKWSVW